MTVQTIPAATLVLLRPGPGGIAEVLMIERAAGMAFAAGALVFPGGRIDPGDRALALVCDDADMGAARIAAIRETIEEVGIAVGLLPTPDDAAVARLRRGLAAGEDFAVLLAREGLRPDHAALTPFARWCPDTPNRRNFDTIFFVAAASPSARARPDGSESVSALWATPQALLDAATAGRHHIVYPTRRNLERLARLGTIEIARIHAAEFPLTRITPYFEERDGTRWLCIPEGCGYPVTAEPFSTVQRG